MKGSATQGFIKEAVCLSSIQYEIAVLVNRGMYCHDTSISCGMRFCLILRPLYSVLPSDLEIDLSKSLLPAIR